MTSDTGEVGQRPAARTSPTGASVPPVVVSSVIHHDHLSRPYPGVTVVLSARAPGTPPTDDPEPPSPPPASAPLNPGPPRITNPPAASSPAGSSPGSGVRRLAALAVLTAALVAVTIPLLIRQLVADGAHTAPAAARLAVPALSAGPPAPTTDDVRAEVVAWTRGALPRRAVIAADPSTVADLRRAGFTAAAPFTDPQVRRPRDVDYVVDIAGSVTRAGDVRAHLVRRSLPLAAFGPSAVASTVRERAAGSAATARERAAEEARVRRLGGRELLANRNLDPDAATETLLRAGELDLRPQNVLSDLTGAGRVRVVAVSPDRAELRADQPARVVRITTSSARTTYRTLTALPTPYRPTTVQRLSGRTVLAVWRPAVTPVDVLGG